MDIVGSESLTVALRVLAFELAADMAVSERTRNAAALLAQCLTVMDDTDTMIAVQEGD